MTKEELAKVTNGELMPLVDKTPDYKNPKVLAVVHNSVAPNATKEEFAYFVHYCQNTGLNPLKREVWFIKAGGRVQVMTGINGFFTIANNHPAFDGMPPVEYGSDEYGEYCKAIVYRKDRKYPSVGLAYMKEFQGNSPLWKQKPKHMLAKVAKSIALREAFPNELNGMYIPEEMDGQGAEVSGGITRTQDNSTNLNQVLELESS